MLDTLALAAALAACAPAPLAPGATDSTYATPALRALVTRACVANRAVPRSLAGYRARVESELGLVLDLPLAATGLAVGTAPARAETAGQVEQVASEVRFTRDGQWRTHVVGYRVQTTAPGPSAMSYLPPAWTAATLYGNRLLILYTDPIDTLPRAQVRDVRQPLVTVHPLAEDRGTVYRFSGGDTVATIRSGSGRTIPLVRVRVEVARVPGPRVGMFRGELLLDAERAQLVRMRGQLFVARPGTRGGLAGRLLTSVAVGRAFVDLENGEIAGRYWLPRTQRLEFQATSGFTEGRAAIRAVSRFRDYALEERAVADAPGDGVLPNGSAAPDAEATLRDAALAVGGGDTVRLVLPRRTFAARDSLARFAAWDRELGADTRETSAADFDDVGPPARRATGAPILRPQARWLSDVVRTNRVEGLYTGVAGVLHLRDRLPGAMVRAAGGWSWGEGTARGLVEGARARGAWVATVRGERALASTNDFEGPLGGGGGLQALAGLAGDPFDYVDRRAASLAVARELGVRHTAALRLEATTASDRAPRVHLDGNPFGGRAYRPLRPVDEGRWTALAATLDFGRNVTGDGMQSGVGGLLAVERAAGALAWTRVQAQLRARRQRGPFVFAARVDAGLLAGADGRAVPTQRLWELGGPQVLPGYDYKAFAGDRTVLARGLVQYLIPVLGTPVRLGGTTMPAIAPALALGGFAGWTDAAASGTRATLDALGWRTTDGARGSVTFGLRLGGGAATLGLARPIDGRGWGGPARFVFAIGSQW